LYHDSLERFRQTRSAAERDADCLK